MKANPGKVIFLGLGSVLLCLALVIGTVNRGLCSWYGQQTERETRYSFLVGCMVKSANGWVPRSELRTAAE